MPFSYWCQLFECIFNFILTYWEFVMLRARYYYCYDRGIIFLLTSLIPIILAQSSWTRPMFSVMWRASEANSTSNDSPFHNPALSKNHSILLFVFRLYNTMLLFILFLTTSYSIYLIVFRLRRFIEGQQDQDPLVNPVDKRVNPWAEKSKCDLLWQLNWPMFLRHLWFHVTFLTRRFLASFWGQFY